MQTFITNSTDSLGVEALDSKRLNKQLLEARQILNILVTMRNDPTATPAWRNHPAVKMWHGHEFQLFRYCTRLVIELNARGIKFDKNYEAINKLMDSLDVDVAEIDTKPDWMTDPVKFDKVITTHRASLYRKAPEFYPAEWDFDRRWVDRYHDQMVCCPRCNYYWPTHVED